MARHLIPSNAPSRPQGRRSSQPPERWRWALPTARGRRRVVAWWTKPTLPQKGPAPSSRSPPLLA